MDLSVADPSGVGLITAIELPSAPADRLALFAFRLTGGCRDGLVSIDNLDGRVGPDVVVPTGSAGLPKAGPDDGDVVVHGRVGARSGIDQKGGTIIVVGDAGMMTGFMMQRGRMILCGDVGPGLGDSMYDGTIYVAGKVASLGIDCVPGEWTDADTEFVERKFRIYGLGSPPELQKLVCGKQLYNYDSLEPAERKLVI